MKMAEKKEKEKQVPRKGKNVQQKEKIHLVDLNSSLWLLYGLRFGKQEHPKTQKDL